jgi:hypothetical protein
MKDPREMTFSELKKWLSDRLQMRGTAAADINIRRDEAPYERPVELWKSGDDDFCNRFKRAVIALIEEAAATPWEPAHIHELGLLVEAANLWETVRPLEDIAQSRRLLVHEHGPQLHMLTLRTLLALGWKGTPDFWLAQKELVGSRWPGIIFEGLARQDLQMAFDRLPELVTNRETMREILNLFPGLMRDLKIGISSLREMCLRILANLPPDAAQVMQEWFRLRNYALSNGLKQTNPTLVVALRVLLRGESEPKIFSARLCAKLDGVCALPTHES